VVATLAAGGLWVILYPGPEHTYTAGYHRFFNDLVNMCLAAACYTAAFLAYRDRPGRFGSGERVAFPGIGGRFGRDLAFHPDQLLSAFVEDERLTVLILEEYPVISIEPLREEALIVSLAMQASFVRYYESVVELIEAAHGRRNQWQQWPDVLRFGKIVRDAFAHNGLVDVKDQNAPASIWRGLSYGSLQNGQQVLYGDLALADIIVLMEQMDDAIPR
jgi:hypothetical protein